MESLMMLLTQQRALQRLTLGPFHDLSHPERFPLPPPRLVSLDIPTEILEIGELNLYSHFIADSPDLKHLAIKTFDYVVSGEAAPNKPHLQDTATEAGRLFPTLFGWKSDKDKQRPLQLEELSIQNQTMLEFAPRTLMDAISFENLKYFDLRWNDKTSDLLRALATRFSEASSKLEGFCYQGDGPPDRTGREEFNALSEFVMKLQGLKYLQIRIPRAVVSFDVSDLGPHLPTLNDLFIGYGTEKGLARFPWTVQDVELLVSAAPNLRQLAIPFPRLKIRNAQSGIWGEFGEMLQTLAQAPNLEIVRILNWPTASAKEVLDTQVFLRFVDAMATFVVQTIIANHGEKPSKLRMVCIGDSQHCEGQGKAHIGGGKYVDLMAAYYLVGKQLNNLGVLTPVAIPIEARRVKHEVPYYGAIHPKRDAFNYDDGIGIGDYGLRSRGFRL